MGRELPDTIADWNAFCEGKHPAFNGENDTHKVLLEGSKNKDLRIHPDNLGVYYRFSDMMSDAALVTGTLNREKPTDMEHLETLLQNDLDEGTLMKTSDVVDQYMHMTDQQIIGSKVIWDDFWIWYKNDFKTGFGKPMIIDQNDTVYHNIFFDDNARDDGTCNIDVRDMQS